MAMAIRITGADVVVDSHSISTTTLTVTGVIAIAVAATVAVVVTIGVAVGIAHDARDRNWLREGVVVGVVVGAG